jgi:cobalt-zinc-cadmium resistance protein CzcA
MSLGALDFGLIVDGAVVMVENIFRELAERHGEQYDLIGVIRSAAKDVERPIFYAVAVIIAGYLPIYVLTGPSGRLFRPMADTMGFALLGSLICTLTLMPVLCSYFLRKQVKEPTVQAYERLRAAYGRMLERCLRHRAVTLVVCLSVFCASLLLVPFIGAEFMPHLDEGALWVRATMPYTISFDEASKLGPQVRDILLSFPQVTTVANELGRPDDGTDPIGFFNDEYFVGLRPYDDSAWTGQIRTKPQLIDAIQDKLKAFPGIIFNYTQPAEDAVDEAETGLKSALAVKVFGDDLNVLEEKGREIRRVLEGVRGISQITVVKQLGQPSLTIDVDRAKIARYGLNVADVNGLIEAAVGGTAATQVVQGEKLFDLVVRLQPQFRETPEAIGNILVATPAGQQVPLKELAKIEEVSGASFIYRENSSRYIGVQYSVEGRDLASAVEDARKQVDARVKMPTGYRAVWGGEYEDYTASRDQLRIILPLTLSLIFILLFLLYSNFKFPIITVLAVLLSGPIGGLIALRITGTPFSVSSGIGFLALFGVSVQTAVIYVSYANELREAGMSIKEATREAAILRLRPIMMTALVAAFGLLPAALSTGIGSDSQRPFALVIVGGLFSRLLISVFLMPALYAIVARPGDHLEV